MERKITVNCIVLLVFSFLVGVVLANSNDERALLAGNHMQEEEKLKGFWMGPRLGRKKRNPKPEEVYCSYVIDREPVVGKDASPLVILAVKKCKKSDFTPRLGRDSGEESFSNAVPSSYGRWLEDSDFGTEMMNQRSPPFVPRLGRHILYQPRLGRENTE